MKRVVLVAAFAALFSVCISGLTGAPAVAQSNYRMPAAGDRIAFRIHARTLYERPTLSPDGRQLAFIDRRLPSDDEVQLVVVDLDAPGGPQRYATTFSDTNPLWVRWGSNTRLLVGATAQIRLRGAYRRYSDMLPPGVRVLSMSPDFSTPPVILFGDEGRSMNWSNLWLYRITDFLPDDPDHILMPAFHRNRYHLWRVNIMTGEADVLESGTRSTRDWFTEDGTAVMRFDVGRSGQRLVVHSRGGPDDEWQRTLSVRLRDIAERDEPFEWAGVTATPGVINVRGRPNTAERMGVYRYNLGTGEFLERLAEHDVFDIDRVMVDGWTGAYLGYGYIDDRQHLVFDDAELGEHFAALREFFGDQAEIDPIGFGGNRILLSVSDTTLGVTYFLYNRDTGAVDALFDSEMAVRENERQRVERFDYTARDGLTIPGFITYPLRGAGPDTPLIVYPHGGPEARDRVAFEGTAQFFAAIGYAVFQPNFRGSYGYGADYVQAGHGEWGRAMQTDLSDGVQALIDQGLVDANRICIAGFSYGGYAALAGAALDPEHYKCVIAGGAVTDLPSFLDFKEDLNDDVYEYWVEQLGDPDNAEQRARMEAVSPTLLAHQIQVPVLLMHGSDDPIVPVDQSQQMAEALAAAGVPHFYIEEEGGHHDWADSRAYRRQVFSNMARFLDDAMDGELDHYEPDFR